RPGEQAPPDGLHRPAGPEGRAARHCHQLDRRLQEILPHRSSGLEVSQRRIHERSAREPACRPAGSCRPAGAGLGEHEVRGLLEDEGRPLHERRGSDPPGVSRRREPVMARNQKLTKVIAGRTITGTETAADTLKVHFDDGSTMTVRTSGPAKGTPTNGKVKA